MGGSRPTRRIPREIDWKAWSLGRVLRLVVHSQPLRHHLRKALSLAPLRPRKDFRSLVDEREGLRVMVKKVIEGWTMKVMALRTAGCAFAWSAAVCGLLVKPALAAPPANDLCMNARVVELGDNAFTNVDA